MDSLVGLSSKTMALHPPPSPCLLRFAPRFFPAFPFFLPNTLRSPFPLFARKISSEAEQPVLHPSIVDELSQDDDEDDDLILLDDGDEGLLEDEDFEDEYFEDEEAETSVGDGAGGGGIALAGTWWDKEALSLAEQVSCSFDGQLQIYAFRTLPNSVVQLRIENISTKSGSPSMSDIEAFSVAYRELLNKAEQAKSVPENLSLEVSSPGVERVVRVPQDLNRFKDRAMYVKYVSEVDASGFSSETEGIFRLISFDTDTTTCIWGLADVRANREKAGKGRPMNKKQREWRLTISFDSLLLVRVYSEA